METIESNENNNSTYDTQKEHSNYKYNHWQSRVSISTCSLKGTNPFVETEVRLTRRWECPFVPFVLVISREWDRA